MMKRSAKEMLEYMARILLLYLEELSGVGSSDDPFLYGEKTAYTECLEWVQTWEEAEQNGLGFDIEGRYPL